MTEGLVLAERDGGVLTLTLNRPDVLNAFNDPMTRELMEAMRGAERDAAIRCIVLTGSGRGFSSGQDLGAFLERQSSAKPAPIREHPASGYNVLGTRERTQQKPIVRPIKRL